MIDIIRTTANLPASHKVEATHNALRIISDLSYDEWEELGRMLQKIGDGVNWWLGDWLVYGEHKYGEKYANAVQVTGRKIEVLKNAQWVANSVKKSTRVDLSWTHHRYVAHLEPAEQKEVLATALKEELTSKETRDLVTRYKALQNGKPEKEPEPQPVDPPEDDGMDWRAEFDRVAGENEELEERVAILTQSEEAKTVDDLHLKYKRLEARLNQEMRTRAEAEKEAKYAKGLLTKVRKQLGVERNSDILVAIVKLQ